MPGSAVVSSVPEGSARLFEWRQNVWHIPGGPTNAVMERGGLSVAGWPGGTNWGFGAGTDFSYVNYKGMYFTRGRAGANLFGPQFQWCTQQPAGGNFSWPSGLVVIEGVFAWPTNTAGVDNGIQVVNNNFQRVVTQAQAGFEIWNNAGNLTFTINGGAGTQTVLLNPGAGIAEPHKIRIEMRNATKLRSASISIVINDIQQARVSGNTLPVSNTNAGWFCNFGTFDIAQYALVRDLRMFIGPDTSIGM